MNGFCFENTHTENELAAVRKRFDGTGLYLFLALGLLPLVFYNGYFDITETKTLFFVCISLIFLLIRLVLFIQSGSQTDGIGDTSICAAAFPFVLSLGSLMASLSSGFFRDSFLGISGRYQGTGMILLYALVYYAFPEHKTRDMEVMLPLGFGLLLSSALAVLDHFGADPLGLSASLGGFDRQRYISTLGNINFAGAYLCLAVPAAARFLLSSKKRSLWSVFAGASFAVGLCAAMACRSECTVLGIGAAVVLMPFTMRKDPEALRRWGLLLTGIAVTMQLYALTALRAGAWFSSITEALLHPAVSAGIGIFGGVWFLVLSKRTGFEKRVLQCYGAALAICALASVILLYLLNTCWRDVPLGSAGPWLHFSNSWGTDRILIWRHCISFYREFSPWEKLFGGGCGILARLDVFKRIFPDAVLDAAHNEYLQILLNWGAVGLAAYIGWIVTAFAGAFRNGSVLSMSILCGLAGYTIQAGVNIAQAPGIMLFFVLLAAAKSADTERGMENAEAVS